MTQTHRAPRRHLLIATAIALSLVGCSSGKQESNAPSDNDASATESKAAQESASTVSTITVFNATPASANGEFHLAAVEHVPSIGGANTYQAVGRSGQMEYGVILTFNAAGVLETVLWTHGSDDGTSKVWAQCDSDVGAQAPCSAGHFKADAGTGAATFDGLVLKGMDQKGDVAIATISGAVR